MPSVTETAQGERPGGGIGHGAPSVILKVLPWHGQSTVPSATLSHRQPTWVHTMLNALNPPGVGVGISSSCGISPARLES